MGESKVDRKVGFLHTTPSTIGMVKRLAQAVLPGVVPVHVYDGNAKIDNFRSPIGVTPKVNLLRWANFAEQLERSGCELIVSCCSLMPRATAIAREVVSVPCIQLDAVVLGNIRELESRGVDCVLLGQVPFGMMEDTIKAMEWKVPVMYAGTEAFEYIRDLPGP